MAALMQRVRIARKLRKLDKRLERDLSRAWQDRMQAWAQAAQDNVRAVKLMDKALQRTVKGA